MNKFAAIFILAVSGCATPESYSMDPWIGATTQEVVEKLGYPDSEISVAGAKKMTWLDKWSTISTIGTTGGQHHYECERSLVIKSGVVVDAKVVGSICARRASEYRR
ncbi:hypothetical protein MACH17_18680 [Phaeobacter inhibens]|uniref:hypothetical protein n=1 Tax=Phaeobacter inhibens TaxID=221822 RepID=UPI002754F05A|nr:hypothetical protein [Phaeobacter inhibens]GLO70351.1 hypothetical protein MACH17_18680 [Phaeobacter inhibens]